MYANALHIRQITDYGWRYVLNVKSESHPSLERQFAGRRASGQVGETRRVDPEGVIHLMDFLDREFQKLTDHRSGNALRYDLADVLSC